MKKFIHSSKKSWFLYVPTQVLLILFACALVLSFSTHSLYAVRGGGEMGVTFTFNAISHSSTFDYSNAHDFKKYHFSDAKFDGVDLHKERLNNCDFTNDINAIVTGATNNYYDIYHKCFYVQNSGNELKTGNGNRGAINFGSTRRPTDWLYKNGTRYTSGIDNFNNDKEYLSLNYLDLKTTKSADPKDTTSEPEYGHTGTDRWWRDLYPTSTVSFKREQNWTTDKDTFKCSTTGIWSGYGYNGNYDGCKNLNPHFPPTGDNAYSLDAGTMIDSKKSTEEMKKEKKDWLLKDFYCSITDECNTIWEASSGNEYPAVFYYGTQKSDTTIKIKHHSEGYGYFQRKNQGVGYAGCEFLPHVGDNSEFKVYGDIFKSAFTNLRINSPFKDGDGNTIDYGIPHLNPSNTTRLSVTCLGTGRFVDNKINIKRKDDGKDTTLNYGRIEAPNGINQQVARLFCLESPKEVGEFGKNNKVIEFRRFEIYRNGVHYMDIEDHVAIVAVPELADNSTIRIEAVYRVKEFDVAVQKYVKTDRSTHKYVGTTIPDSFHIKEAKLPSYNSDSIRTTP